MFLFDHLYDLSECEWDVGPRTRGLSRSPRCQFILDCVMEGYQCHNCKCYYRRAILHFKIFKVLHGTHRIKNVLPILLNGIIIFLYPILIVLFLTNDASKLMMVYL